MLRLILADDEKIIRESISRLIDWKQYGIELIGTCRDGIETYNMILDEYPDVVMTDIKMPGLDGLDLIKKVNDMQLDTEFVILSGYSEFEFAKKAMEFGVKYYLLKPISEAQILDAMEKVKRDRKKKQSIHHLKMEKESLSNQFQPIIRKQFIIESITCEGNFESLLDRYVPLFQFDKGNFALYYISFLEQNDLPHFLREFASICSAWDCHPCFPVLYVKNTVSFLVNYGVAADLSGFDRELKSLKIGKVGLYFQCLHFSGLKKLFGNLVPNLQRYEKIYLIAENGAQNEIYNYGKFFRNIDDVANSVLRDPDSAEKTVRDFFRTIRDLELVRTLSSKLMVQVDLREGGPGSCPPARYFQKLYECKNPDEVVELTVRSLKTELSRTEPGHSSYIRQIVGYLDRHYGDANLSLKWIAENYIFMNVNYLSKQFCKETGVKFSCYLNRLRMEHAKERITRQDVPRVSQIASEVGFGGNSQYFSQAFKKFFGVTPSEYIERNRSAHSNK